MEKPILFSTAMVQAILAGRKTQTRRVIKGAFEVCKTKDGFITDIQRVNDNGMHIGSINPLYHPGDILWVRETWGRDKHGKYHYRADYPGHDCEPYPIWHPSIHMPREAARLFLTVKDIRAEKLHDMTETDAIWEGAFKIPNTPEYEKALNEAVKNKQKPPLGESPRQRFKRLWDSINTKRGYGWDTNPFVWVIKFERTEGA